MFILTPDQALVFFIILLIIFLINSFKNRTYKDLDKLPRYKEAIRSGYTITYCREMFYRDMCFRNGEWVPKSGPDNRDDPNFITRMRMKDIILSDKKQWMLTGKPLDKVYKNRSRDSKL